MDAQVQVGRDQVSQEQVGQDQIGQDQIGQLHPEARVPPWTPACRGAFRFCFVYFGLYCVATQILGSLVPIPKVEIPDIGSLWPMRQITFWTAAHIFRAHLPLVYADSGSGDKTFDWVLVFWLLIASALATGIWSFLDRKRENYVTLYKSFRVFIRIALAGQMLTYGMDKLIPLQMPYPFLTR